MEFVKAHSPYLRRKDSLSRMMLDVIIALLPALVMSFIAYGLDALRNVLLSIAVMVISEAIFVLIRNPLRDGGKHSLKEKLRYGFSFYHLPNLLAPMVSALIFALIMPPRCDNVGLSYFAIVIGALSGIVLGKLVYGGTGNNIFNPAAVGMVIAKISFGSHFVYQGTDYVKTLSGGGTALGNLTSSYSSIGQANILDLFLGRTPGVIGEGCKIAIIIGLAYLLIRRAASWYSSLSYILSFAFIMSFIAIPVCLKYGYSYWRFMGFELFSGGLLFGAVFMITDPVSTPITNPGRVLGGIIAGILTVVIRLFAPIPEGVVYSILIVNLITPAIDYRKWASNKFTLKKNIFMVATLVLMTVIIVLAFTYGGYLK